MTATADYVVHDASATSCMLVAVFSGMRVGDRPDSESRGQAVSFSAKVCAGHLSYQERH
ncbi:hypothetical protein AB0N24_23645 [Arthrobacter sp. NPDC093128]|uniref:hypothetical protein n=1 Tax=Arthrobacter sp. NPDC093128 TaxID=3154979 RepID=UPI003424A9ED